MSEVPAEPDALASSSTAEPGALASSSTAEPGASDAESGGDRAEAVLAYLAEQLVDDRDAVVIESGPARNGGTRLSLRVASGDMGKVIGRRGRVAQSIRGVVRAAGAAEGHDVTVDIVD